MSIHETAYYLPPHKRFAINSGINNNNYDAPLRKLTVFPAGPAALHAFRGEEFVKVSAEDIIAGDTKFLFRLLSEMLNLPRQHWQLFLGDTKMRSKALLEIVRKWNKGAIILHFVHITDTVIWTYLLRPSSRQLQWRLLSPCSPSFSSAITYQALATTRFNLVSPFPEEHSEDVWKYYLEQRLRLEARQSYKPPPAGTANNHSIHTIIRDAPFDLLHWGGIPESFCRTLCDGVLIVSAQYQHTNYVTEGRVFTRIYPPHSLHHIEVAFSHHFVRGESPDGRNHGCALGFRHVLVDEIAYDKAMIRRLWSRGVERMFLWEQNGWNNVFYALQRVIEDDGREKRGVGIDGEDVQDIIEYLGILGEDGGNTGALALRFLLATVTVDAGVTTAGEVNENVRDNALGPFPWKLGAEPYWFARMAEYWCRGRSMRKRQIEGNVEVDGVAEERKRWREIVDG